ncbi:MAG: DUF2784 domain-containing protein [Verrucomicrobia bacterium]|nr:DUF2784 domain-containing protein [Verrucomicrobiota bacterium]
MNVRVALALADLVLVIHFAFVAFVVIGLILVWLGWWRRWEWVRNFWFRLLHLLAMGFVAAEAVLGVTCPLTTWENQLRLTAGGGERYAGSFIQHWIHKVMFFQLPERVFTMAYLIVLAAIMLSFWVVPPRWPWRR